MQSAPNRDEYVKIFWENIAEGKEHNFRKYNSSYVKQIDVGYDFKSIMHFSSRVFAKDPSEYTIWERVSFRIAL